MKLDIFFQKHLVAINKIIQFTEFSQLDSYYKNDFYISEFFISILSGISFIIENAAIYYMLYIYIYKG